MTGPLSETDARLTLACVEGLAPRIRIRLCKALGGPDGVCSAGLEALRATGASRDTAERIAAAVARGAAAAARAEASRLGAEVVLPDAEVFPEALRRIDDPPALLFVRGDLRPEDDLAVAIVGARRCTEWGRGFARRLAHDLALAGCTVVSGGARGIDSAAHAGALEAGGRTLSVAGCGLGHPYPSENRRLFEQIATSGACLSELSCDQRPRPYQFPWRNRIIAGLALVTVVVEGRTKSGAAHTARAALDYHREVGAVPGRAGSPDSGLPHRLLRDGALMVESAADVLDAIPPFALPVRRDPPHDDRAAPQGDDAQVLAALGDDPLVLAEISARAGTGPGAVMAALTRLELARHVRPLPGGRWVAR